MHKGGAEAARLQVRHLHDHSADGVPLLPTLSHSQVNMWESTGIGQDDSEGNEWKRRRNEGWKMRQAGNQCE